MAADVERIAVSDVDPAGVGQGAMRVARILLPVVVGGVNDAASHPVEVLASISPDADDIAGIVAGGVVRRFVRVVDRKVPL